MRAPAIPPLVAAFGLADDFHRAIMTAMITGSPAERARLAWAYPRVADFLRDNGYPGMPGEHRGEGDPGPRCGGYEDLEGQLQCAMGDDIHPGWAPSVIEIIRHRHPGIWKDAVAAARKMDEERKEF
jgi:hypothetical protein